MSRSIKVLVVDDSAFNRRTIIKMLETVPGVEIVGYASDGEEGLRKFIDLVPDIITLDLEMPKMDGFAFLRVVMQYRPTPVIVVSARSEDENVFKALEFGAVEFIAKPTATVSPQLVNIREDLVQKVMEISRTDMSKVLRRDPQGTAGDGTRVVRAGSTGRDQQITSGRAGKELRLVAIGSSTGGPPALQAILTALPKNPDVAYIISQHMPPGFTKAFADRLNRFCALEIHEAKGGERLSGGRVYIAPGGRNLRLVEDDEGVSIDVAHPSPAHRYVPNVDEMFCSAAPFFAGRMLAVVLTGMGNDGAKGVVAVHRHGGKIFAEAEETSVVFGMPKEAIATGKVNGVFPLRSMAAEIERFCSEG